eukprot:9125275-Pyramimonas_sp.AAC.1
MHRQCIADASPMHRRCIADVSAIRRDPPTPSTPTPSRRPLVSGSPGLAGAGWGPAALAGAAPCSAG